jgi:hypothetical protein
VASRSLAFARGIFGVVSVLILAALLATALLARGVVRDQRPVGALAPGTPEQLKSGAATALEAVLAPGGGGVRFEILQVSTMQAKAGGPKIDVPDPANPRRTLEFADTYRIGALIEHGSATPAGFFSEMLVGPAAGAKPDWAHAPVLYSALVVKGERWRNDGDGWYRAEALPGIGLDPETAVLLPRLLRNGTDATDKGSVPVDGASLRAIELTGKEADIPGLVAADGERFTKLIEPMTIGFDGAGRLAWLRSVALNMNMTDFDLVIETEITFSYDAVDSLPSPDSLELAPAEATR